MIGGFKAGLLGTAGETFVAPVQGDGTVAVRGTSSARQDTAGQTMTIGLPGGVVADDVIYIFYMTDGNARTHTTPAGYTAIKNSHNGSGITGSLYRRVATGSDTDPVTLTTDGTEEMSALCIVFFDVDEVTPEDFVGDAQNRPVGTATWTDPGPNIPTEYTTTLVTFLCTDSDNSATPFVIPPNHFEHIKITGQANGVSGIVTTMDVLGRGLNGEQYFSTKDFEDDFSFTLLIRSKTPNTSDGHPFIKSHSQNSEASGTTVVLTPPTHVADDILLAVYTTDGTETHTTPATWTALVDSLAAGSDTMSVYWKKTAGAEGDVTFTTGSSEAQHVVMVAIDDAHLTTPFEVVGATDTDTDTVTGLTSLSANSLLLAIMMTSVNCSHVTGSPAGKDHPWFLAVNELLAGWSDPVIAYTHHDTTGVEGNVTGFIPNAGVIWASVMLAVQPV